MADKQSRPNRSWIDLTRGYQPISKGSGKIIPPPAGAVAADVPASPENEGPQPIEDSSNKK